MGAWVLCIVIVDPRGMLMSNRLQLLTIQITGSLDVQPL